MHRTLSSIRAIRKNDIGCVSAGCVGHAHVTRCVSNYQHIPPTVYPLVRPFRGDTEPVCSPPPCTSIHHLSRELMLQFCANQAAVLGDGCAVCRVWLGWQGCIFSAANKPLPSMALHTTTVYTQGTLSPSAPPPLCSSIRHLSHVLMLQLCAGQAAVLGDGCAGCRVWLGWHFLLLPTASQALTVPHRMVRPARLLAGHCTLHAGHCRAPHGTPCSTARWSLHA